MKVSVVIPTYKRPKSLSKAISSVLEQTFQDFELNVISDGFHEETDLLMKQYSDIKKINYYFYSENKGGNYARNYGIKKSTGEYIAFLDDDDLWEQTKLEKQTKILDDRTNIGLVYTGKKVVFPSLNISYENLPKETGDLSKKIFYSNYIGSTSSVMIRKEILEETGLFDENLPSMQDRELWIRICQITAVDAVNEPLLLYINEDFNQQISSSLEKKYSAFEKINIKHKKLLKENPRCKQAFEKKFLESVLRIAQKNNDKQTLNKLSKLYLNKYKNIKSGIFVISTRIPQSVILRLRSLIK